MEEHGNPLQQRSASGPQPPSAFVLQVGAGALMHICCSLPARAAPKGRTSAPCRTGKVTSGRTCYTLSSGTGPPRPTAGRTLPWQGGRAEGQLAGLHLRDPTVSLRGQAWRTFLGREPWCRHRTRVSVLP